MNLMELFLMILWNRVARSLQITISVKFIIVISRYLLIYLYVLFKLIVKFFQKLYKQLDILNIFFKNFNLGKNKKLLLKEP